MILRQHRHYLLNVITMMVDAQIPDLKSKQSREILDKINEKFLPDLEDSAANARLSEIIDESVNAIFPEIGE